MNIEEFIDFLDKANEAYRLGNPIISDEEYDRLIEKLRNENPNHPFLNSPEPEPIENRSTVKHPNLMLSTNKAYEIKELQRFFKFIEKFVENPVYRITPKLDGLSARYDNGKLFTRGDGEKGYDISDATLKGVNTSFTMFDHEIGEIVLKSDYFENYLSDKYPHPRNIVAGGCMALELNETQKETFKSGNVVFYPFSLLPSIHTTSDEIISNLDNIFNELQEKVAYPTDGIVIELFEDDKIKEQIGNTSHHYRWQIAFKKQNETGYSTIREITWQTGRGGNITPVLEIDPIKLSGATISRVTAHNYGFLKDKKIGIGTVIEIVRSGEVIPKIIGVKENPVDNVEYIEKCPVCDETTILENDIIKCLNFECSAQIIGRLSHFFQTIEVDLFGEKTIEKLVQNGFSSIIDIYNKLTEEELKEMGFGPKQSKNLIEELTDSLCNSIEDYKFLAAISIPLLGKSVAKKILQNYSLSELETLTEIDLRKVEGFGKKKAKIIYQGIQENKHIIEFLLNGGFNIKFTKDNEIEINNKLNSKKFVFTGKMERKRDEMKELCESNGGIALGSINKNTDYLVCGENVGKSKLDKASKFGIQKITEKEFIKFLS